MFQLGFTLSSEEHDPRELVKFAQWAEEAGFSFLSISDHFHPWVDEQGQSPFVWNVIGALSEVTKRVDILIGVNAPIMRYHPAIVAQAAATSQVQLEGRFLLGVGTGENLNEHIIGQGWPAFDQRLGMLNEAIQIMRMLWSGEYVTYFGDYYSIDSAKIYTKPEVQIPIIYSAFGKKAAAAAGKFGDAFISTGPNDELIKVFTKNGGKGKAKYAQISVCYDKDREKAKKILAKFWPNSSLPKPLNTELKLPSHFKNATTLLDPDKIAEGTPIGPDIDGILESIQKYIQAGYDHLYIHNIGPNQKEFIEFAEKNILPNFQQKSTTKEKKSVSQNKNNNLTKNRQEHIQNFRMR